MAKLARKPPTIIIDNALGDAQALFKGDPRWTETYWRYIMAANFLFDRHGVDGLSLKLGSHANLGVPEKLPEPSCEFRLKGRKLAYIHAPTRGTDGMPSAFEIFTFLKERIEDAHSVSGKSK